MNIGSIRISRDKQTPALQEDAIHKEQCERVFIEKGKMIKVHRRRMLITLLLQVHKLFHPTRV